MAAMAVHTHDSVDWAARLPAMRRSATLDAPALAGVAARLTARLPPGATIVDAGCGVGPMSGPLVAELARRGGGTLVLIDAVPELLAAAVAAAEETAEAIDGAAVEIRSVHADVAGTRLADVAPPADLIWASAMVHHLPNQQAGVTALAAGLREGGVLALGEGGLETRCLPWELGVGEPGLERRLLAARGEWFTAMRTGMAGAVPMPYGWGVALRHAGLTDVAAFSYLVDYPAPAGAAVREYVVEHLAWLAGMDPALVSEDDRAAVARLVDPGSPDYLGTRDDVYLLAASTVHVGSRP
jgi:SAM-dependent methyltransferase